MDTIYQSPLSPFAGLEQGLEHISISQFFTQYNPEGVADDKIIHTDEINQGGITYGGLRRGAGRIAWGLRKRLGLQEGDTILALVPNSNDFVLLAHGTWWAGGVFAPLNPSSTQSDLEHVIKLLRPTHVVVAKSKLDVVSKAIKASKSDGIKLFTVFGKADNILQFPEDIIGSSDSESLPPYSFAGKSGKDIPSTICLSSGTTGNMKGVKLSHFNLISNVVQIRLAVPSRQTSEAREVWFTPYCHIYGLFGVVMSGMWLGGTYHGLHEFNLEHFCKKSSEMQVTDMHIVPPIALLLTTSPVSMKYDLSSVKRIVVAAAPLKVELQARLKKRFPQASVCQGYGLTECSPAVSHQLETDEHHVGSVGKLVPGTELRLVDPETGKDVPIGQEGEIWIRGPQVMMGYVNDGAATKQTFCEGWLRTGDIAKMINNNLWITDRLKEMIKYKGFQVAPSELEDFLLQHPAVTDAAVCATYSDVEATEIPLAYVSLTQDGANLPSAEKERLLNDIRTWADSKLAGYKKLRGGIFHLQTLPKNPTGKIMRRLLPVKLKESRSQKL